MHSVHRLNRVFRGGKLEDDHLLTYPAVNRRQSWPLIGTRRKSSYFLHLLIGLDFFFCQSIDHCCRFAAKAGMSTLAVVKPDPFPAFASDPVS